MNTEQQSGAIVMIGGEEYIQVRMDEFQQMFLDLSKKAGVREEILKQVNQFSLKVKRIKKRRIRHKKLKELVLYMYDIIVATEKLDRPTLVALGLIE